jgi:DNA-binding transcriptional MerR regulator
MNYHEAATTERIWCRLESAARISEIPVRIIQRWHWMYNALPERPRGRQRYYGKADLMRLIVARDLLVNEYAQPREVLELVAKILPEELAVSEILDAGRFIVWWPHGERLVRCKDETEMCVALMENWKDEASAVMIVDLERAEGKLVDKVAELREQGLEPAGMHNKDIVESE